MAEFTDTAELTESCRWWTPWISELADEVVTPVTSSCKQRAGSDSCSILSMSLKQPMLSKRVVVKAVQWPPNNITLTCNRKSCLIPTENIDTHRKIGNWAQREGATTAKKRFFSTNSDLFYKDLLWTIQFKVCLKLAPSLWRYSLGVFRENGKNSLNKLLVLKTEILAKN